MFDLFLSSVTSAARPLRIVSSAAPDLTPQRYRHFPPSAIPRNNEIPPLHVPKTDYFAPPSAPTSPLLRIRLSPPLHLLHNSTILTAHIAHFSAGYSPKCPAYFQQGSSNPQPTHSHTPPSPPPALTISHIPHPPSASFSITAPYIYSTKTSSFRKFFPIFA